MIFWESMNWESDKEAIIQELTPELYETQHIETLWNAKREEFREKGWTLKSGIWSPWFLNLRPLPSHPELFSKVGYVMAQLYQNEMPDCDRILGVEMAGIPIASATTTEGFSHLGIEIPMCYTRPLGDKARTPHDAEILLKKYKELYGEKSLVEGEILSGDNIAIWDDMVTNIGSKLIARMILLYEADVRGLEDVKCYHIGVLLDREQGESPAAEKAKEAGMVLHSVIPFRSKGLPLLANAMQDAEYGLITDYQTFTQKYQSEEARNYVLSERRAFNPGQPE